MAGVRSQVKNLGIPNVLSIIRIILIPIFIIVLFFSVQDSRLMGSATGYSRGRLFAAVILVSSCVTDILDGIIARKMNMVTSLGRILDPLADKLTQTAVSVCLVVWSIRDKEYAPVFLMGAFLVKEVLMIIGGAKIIRKGKEVISSKWFGKLSAVVFFIVMISIIAYPFPAQIFYLLIGISLAFMIFSFIMYIPIFISIAGKGGEKTDT